MNIEQLKDFTSIVRFRSFTKAAEHLFISQPSLSRHLSELEQELGAELIERGNTKVFALTPAGEFLFYEGEKLLQKIDEIERHVKKAGAGQVGSLRICSRETSPPLPNRLIHSFSTLYPDIMLDYFEPRSDPLFQNILNGSADIAIVYTPHELGTQHEKLEVLTLVHDHFCVLVSNMNPLARRDTVSVADLQEYRLIYVPEYGTSAQEDDPIQQVMRPFLAGSLICNSFPSMMLQTRANIGFSILPATAALVHDTGCKMLEFNDLFYNTDLSLAWLKETRNPCLHVMIDFAKRFLAEYPPDES